MEELFTRLLDWIGANPGWAYWTVGLVAFTESLAVIGFMVPGVLILLGAGALIGAGQIDFWPACTAAITGAIIGEALSFWLGHHYHERILGVWPFRRHPEQIARGMRFFARHGTKGIVIGRFFGPVRAILPLIAGLMRMSPRRFLIANTASALVWAPAYLAPGILFGASLKLAAEAATRLVILIILLLVLLWLSLWLARRLFRFLSPRSARWVASMLSWAERHPGMGQFAQALADPRHPEARTLGGLATLLLFATAILALTLGLLMTNTPLQTINEGLYELGQSLHTPFANQLMFQLGLIGSWQALSILGAVVLLYLLGQRQAGQSLYWIASLGFAVVATGLLGPLLEIQGPLEARIMDPKAGTPPPGHPFWSFPNAPVLGSILVYGLLATMIAPAIPTNWRWLVYAIPAMLVTAVVSAQLYFGWSWFTDLVVSLALGLIWLSALGLAFHRHGAARGPWRGLAMASLLGLLLGLGGSALAARDQDLGQLEPERPISLISEAQWSQGDCDLLPQRRNDLWPGNGRRFALLYAGDLDSLTDALSSQDWQPATTLNWGNMLQWLSPSAPLAELPLIPHVHESVHQQLALTRTWIPDDSSSPRRLVLRLWDSGCRLDTGSGLVTPIWVATLTELQRDSLLWLISAPVTAPDNQQALEVFKEDIDGTPGLVFKKAGGPGSGVDKLPLLESPALRESVDGT